MAVYFPATMLPTVTLNEGVDVPPAVSLPLDGVTVSQGWEGVPAVQVRVPPPVLVMVMVWAAGLAPTVVVKARAVALNCIAGGGGGGAVMVTFMATDAGLPATTPPVAGSTALMVTEVEAVVPEGKPVPLTLIVRMALAPAARLPLASGVMVT